MEKLNEIPIPAGTSLDTFALDTVFDDVNVTDQSIPPEEALPQRKKCSSCKQHLCARECFDANRKTCRGCLRMHRERHRRKRKERLKEAMKRADTSETTSRVGGAEDDWLTIDEELIVYVHSTSQTMRRILITMRGELLCLIVTRERNDVCCTIIIPSKVDIKEISGPNETAAG